MGCVQLFESEEGIQSNYFLSITLSTNGTFCLSVFTKKYQFPSFYERRNSNYNVLVREYILKSITWRSPVVTK